LCFFFAVSYTTFAFLFWGILCLAFLKSQENGSVTKSVTHQRSGHDMPSDKYFDVKKCGACGTGVQ